MLLLQGNVFASAVVLVRQTRAELAAAVHKLPASSRAIKLYRLGCRFAPNVLVIIARSRRLDGGRFAVAPGMTALHR